MRDIEKDIRKNSMKLDQFTQLKRHAEFSPLKGSLKNPDTRLSGENALCGDKLKIELKLQKGIIKDAKFTHQGCALSGASASIFLEYAIGKKYKNIEDIAPEKIIKMLGGNITPARIPCALLPLALFKSKK